MASGRVTLEFQKLLLTFQKILVPIREEKGIHYFENGIEERLAVPLPYRELMGDRRSLQRVCSGTSDDWLLAAQAAAGRRYTSRHNSLFVNQHFEVFMESTDPEFLNVLQNLRSGEEQAAQEIYLRYINQLVTLATLRLDRQYRHKIDPECVAHSAMKSFLIGCRDGKYELQNWAMVYGLLADITFKKALRRNRHAGAQVRNDRGAATFEDWMQAGQSIDPSQTLELQELLQHAFERSGLDAKGRQMVERMLDGYTVSEVADEHGVTGKTVQRKVDKFRKGVQMVQNSESRA